MRTIYDKYFFKTYQNINRNNQHKDKRNDCRIRFKIVDYDDKISDATGYFAFKKAYNDLIKKDKKIDEFYWFDVFKSEIYKGFAYSGNFYLIYRRDIGFRVIDIKKITFDRLYVNYYSFNHNNFDPKLRMINKKTIFIRCLKKIEHLKTNAICNDCLKANISKSIQKYEINNLLSYK
jgi:hypothetical protein